MSDYVDYKQWFKENVARIQAWYERWLDPPEFDRAKKKLFALGINIDDLQNAVNSMNAHMRSAQGGYRVSPDIIEWNRRQIEVTEISINQLINEINEQVQRFRTAGQQQVENYDWLVPRAWLVVAGGALLIVASLAAPAASLGAAASWLSSIGAILAVGGGVAAIGSHAIARNTQHRNSARVTWLTESLERLQDDREQIQTSRLTIQPQDDGPSATARMRRN